MIEWNKQTTSSIIALFGFVCYLETVRWYMQIRLRAGKTVVSVTFRARDVRGRWVELSNFPRVVFSFGTWNHGNAAHQKSNIRIETHLSKWWSMWQVGKYHIRKSPEVGYQGHHPKVSWIPEEFQKCPLKKNIQHLRKSKGSTTEGSHDRNVRT